MSVPIVSVVMPVFNAAATLDEAVGSLVSQTLHDFELVAVDDGSTDGSVERLRAFAAADGRVHVLARTHEGIVAALNAGLAVAAAPYVARMDADDLSLPRRLQAQVEWLDAHPDVAVAGCRVECFPAEAVTEGMRHYQAWLNGLVAPDAIALEMFVESPLAHPTAMLRRDVLDAVAGYRDGPFPEDYDLWLRLHAAGHRLGKVPEVLLAWRERGGRLTRTDPRYSADAFRRLKLAHLDVFLRGRREVQVCGAGPDAKAWGRLLPEAGIRVLRHFDVDPRKIGGRLAGSVPVLDWQLAAGYRDVPMLCAVGAQGRRPVIRGELDLLGFREGDDYLFVQ